MWMLIPVMLGLLAAEQEPSSSKAVAESVAGWERRTQIDVVDFSTDRLSTELPRMVAGLKLTTPTAVDLPSDYETFVLTAFTESYLYWSRDQADPGVRRLGETTVDRQRLAAFLERHQPLSGRPVARLDVKSSPDSGHIQIDGDAKGRTNNVFVVSVGRHSVVVAPPGGTPCTRYVTVAAGQALEVTCP